MTLESWQFGDPERVLIRKQEFEQRKARACAACTHARHIEFNGETLHACEFKRKTYGKRCELFSITTEKNHDR